MRGEVEIWRAGELVHKEHNMLVDGAGELLADVMTVSPSLSAIADTATSSILDASNYTIQAISFATDKVAFKNNAHFLDAAKGTLLSSVHASEAVAAVSNANQSTSSYTPVVGISSPPNPVLTVLEPDSNVDAELGGVEVSSLFPGPDQNVNVIPLSRTTIPVHHHNMLSSLGSLSSVGASILGCFPDGSSFGGTDFSAFSGVGYSAENVVFSGNYDSAVNEASSMDTSGYVNMVMSGSPGTTSNYLMSSTLSGLCVSGGIDPTNSGTVEYSMILGSGDVGFSNLYGGIYNMGLWTIDMDETLRSGNTPPYSFGPLDNPRKYRLFATKHLTKNLGFINDHSTNAGALNYKDLTIKWRLHFI